MKLRVQIYFVMGPPGPVQWVYFIDVQPIFRLELFSVQRSLHICCTVLQPVYSSLQPVYRGQQPAQAKSAVLTCAVTYVEVCSFTMSFLAVDVFQVQVHPCYAPCLEYRLCMLQHKLASSSEDAQSC